MGITLGGLSITAFVSMCVSEVQWSCRGLGLMKGHAAGKRQNIVALRFMIKKQLQDEALGMKLYIL